MVFFFIIEHKKFIEQPLDYLGVSINSAWLGAVMLFFLKSNISYMYKIFIGLGLTLPVIIIIRFLLNPVFYQEIFFETFLILIATVIPFVGIILYLEHKKLK